MVKSLILCLLVSGVLGAETLNFQYVGCKCSGLPAIGIGQGSITFADGLSDVTLADVTGFDFIFTQIQPPYLGEPEYVYTYSFSALVSLNMPLGTDGLPTGAQTWQAVSSDLSNVTFYESGAYPGFNFDTYYADSLKLGEPVYLPGIPSAGPNNDDFAHTGGIVGSLTYYTPEPTGLIPLGVAFLLALVFAKGKIKSRRLRSLRWKLTH